MADADTRLLVVPPVDVRAMQARAYALAAAADELRRRGQVTSASLVAQVAYATGFGGGVVDVAAAAPDDLLGVARALVVPAPDVHAEFVQLAERNGLPADLLLSGLARIGQAFHGAALAMACASAKEK